MDENEIYEIIDVTTNWQNSIQQNQNDEGVNQINEEALFEEEPEEQKDEEMDLEEEQPQAEIVRTRSVSIVKPVIRTNLCQQNLPTLEQNHFEYGKETSRVIERVIHRFKEIQNSNRNFLMIQTFNIRQGLQNFGNKDYQAALEEMN